MKLLLGITVICALGAVMAASAGEREEKQTVVGYLVDIACVTQQSAELTTLGPKHTRNCLSMSECERSGYAILTKDKKIIKFDRAGNEQVRKLLNSSAREKDFRITATGNVGGDEMHIIKLKLQK